MGRFRREYCVAGWAAKLDTRDDDAVGRGLRRRRDNACARDFPVGRSGGQNTVKSLNGATSIYYTTTELPVHLYLYVV